MIKPSILKRDGDGLEVASDSGGKPTRPRELSRPLCGKGKRKCESVSDVALQIAIWNAINTGLATQEIGGVRGEP